MLKMGITMHEKLAERLDKYAEENFMTRSGVISLAVQNYLNAQELNSVFRELNSVLKEIAEKELVDEDCQDRLDKLSEVIEMMTDGTIRGV